MNIHDEQQLLADRDRLFRACKVLVSTPAIREFLQANDPKALEQADRALVQCADGLPWVLAKTSDAGTVWYWRGGDEGWTVYRDLAWRYTIDQKANVAPLLASIPNLQWEVLWP